MRDDQLWDVHHGDAIPHMLTEMPAKCVDFSVYSPPFPQVFAYSQLDCDLGNSEDLKAEAPLHFSFFFRALLRVMKPGRSMVCHCTQIHRRRDEKELGLFDFRGLLIRLAQRAGWKYEYDWMYRRNPQAQAIRTRKWELKFQGLESDRAISRGAMPDYLIKFRAPGKNAVPIDSKGEVSRNDWINWAEPCWDDISETNTLNKGTKAEKEARGDTVHVCPLQKGVVSRLIRLYSNPGELVFSPFAGIGTELEQAVRLSRRAYGCEIKREYVETLMINVGKAEVAVKEAEFAPLFS